MTKQFFKDIDTAWQRQGDDETPLHLQVFGSTALFLQEPRYQRGTKDTDVLETSVITPVVRAALEKIAGRGTTLHKEHKIYLEVVSSGIPFLPHPPQWLPWWDLEFANLKISVLAIADVIVSKLIRFNGSDRDDIAEMIDRNRASHEELIQKFRSAMDYFGADARATQLPNIIDNFNSVERDFFGVTETRYELPSWCSCDST